MAWNALAAALWFLMPKRPGYFFWYLTRNHGDEGGPQDALTSLQYYWDCLISDYHAGLAALLIVLGLMAVALLAWRSLRAGGVAILVFAVLATFKVQTTPRQK